MGYKINRAKVLLKRGGFSIKKKVKHLYKAVMEVIEYISRIAVITIIAYVTVRLCQTIL